MQSTFEMAVKIAWMKRISVGIVPFVEGMRIFGLVKDSLFYPPRVAHLTKIII